MNDLDTVPAFVRALIFMVLFIALCYALSIVLAGMAAEAVPGV